MRILNVILSIGFGLFMLSGCSDESEANETQQANTQPVVQLSEQPTKENIVKVWAGTWISECVYNSQFPTQSAKAEIVFELSPNPVMVYNTRIAMHTYDTTDCSGKSRIERGAEQDGKDFPNGYLATMEVLDIEKGVKTHEIFGTNYLIIKKRNIQQYGMNVIVTEYMSASGNQLALFDEELKQSMRGAFPGYVIFNKK